MNLTIKNIRSTTVTGFVLTIVAVMMMTSCNKVTYRKTAGGMPYKVFKGKNGTPIMPGNYIKISMVQHVTSNGKDSIYFNSAGKLPLYIRVAAETHPYDISELWTKLHVGDSVIATQMMDTFIKRSPANVPQQFRNGDEVKLYIKVLEVFKSDSAAMADDSKTRKEWLQNEIDFVGKYVAGKNITTQKTPSGIYVQTITPGEGNLVDSGKYVSVKYKGSTFAGKVFDTNMDSSFHHTDLLSFTVGTGEMIKGFDEGVQFMRKGGTARIYIPSSLAWGANPSSPNIKPYEHIIFDVTVVDVLDKAPPPPPTQTIPQPKIDRPQQNK